MQSEKGAKRILITGGMGYIGVELTKSLLNAGYFVRVLDLMIFDNPPIVHKNLEIFKGNVHDSGFFCSHLKDVDVLIHLAFLSNDPKYEMSGLVSKTANTRGFHKIIEHSLSHNINRIIFASSCSVYGDAMSDSVDEHSSINPLTSYAADKVYCEDVLASFGKASNANFIILRPATVFGMSERFRLDLSFNKMIFEGLKKREINVANPDKMRPSVHIKDLVYYYRQFVEVDLSSRIGKLDIFNVAFMNRTLLESANAVKKHLGDDIVIKSTRTPDVRSYSVNSDKLLRLFGERPVYGLEYAAEELRTTKELKEEAHYINIERYKRFFIENPI